MLKFEKITDWLWFARDETYVGHYVTIPDGFASKVTDTQPNGLPVSDHMINVFQQMHAGTSSKPRLFMIFEMLLFCWEWCMLEHTNLVIQQY